MRPFTTATLTTAEAFEADLAAGDRRGMQLELGQFRQGVACAAVLVTPDKDMERRVVLACALPASEMMTSARVVRAKLLTVARAVADGIAARELTTRPVRVWLWPGGGVHRAGDTCRLPRCAGSRRTGRGPEPAGCG